MGGDFSSKDLKSIAETAGFDMPKIKQAYEIMTCVHGGVDNPTGFMVRAIKDGYKQSKPQKPRGKSTFNNFTQNSYNFIELEEQLLDN